jgi:hypothetical protein
MKRLWSIAGVAAMALASCGKPENPLVTAGDAQFAQWIEPKNSFSASCAAALYEPELFVKQYNGLKFAAAGKISTVSEHQKADCIVELQKRAAQAGVGGDVAREHLSDDRVRKRYLAVRKG